MDVVVEDGHASPNEGGLLGFPGSGPSRGRDVDACLERAVHLLESSAGVTIEAPSQEGDEQTAELLPLNEPSAHRSEGFDLKNVFAVEESRKAEAAQPSQLAVRDDRLDGGSKSHRPGPRRPDEHVDPVHEAGELLRLVLDLLEAERDRDRVQVDFSPEVRRGDDVLDLDHRVLLDRDAGRLDLFRDHVDCGLDVLEALCARADDFPAAEQERRRLGFLQSVDESRELFRLVLRPSEGEGDRLEVEFLSQGRRGDDVLNLDFGQSYTTSRCGLESRNGVEY